MARVSTPYDVKQRRKQSLLSSLAKLEDRDTQGAASSELAAAFRSLDAEGLGLFVSCLCNTGEKQKVYARKESLSLLGLLATNECPVQQLALQQPHVAKIISAVRSKFKDPDSSVREAAADATANIACGLSQTSDRMMDHEHPLVKTLLESLKEAGGKEAQGAAADALRKKAVVKVLLGKACMAPGNVVAVLAGLDDSKPGIALEGFVGDSPAALLQFVGAVIGAPAAAARPASGIFALMQNREWAVRRAACEAVYAMAVQLGPAMDKPAAGDTLSLPAAGDGERPSVRAAQAVEQSKFDRVAEVRRRATATLGILAEVQEFIEAGQPADAWFWDNSREEMARDREARRPLSNAACQKDRCSKPGGDVDVIVKAQGAARPTSASEVTLSAAKAPQAGENGNPAGGRPMQVPPAVSQSADCLLAATKQSEGASPPRVSPNRRARQAQDQEIVILESRHRPSTAQPLVAAAASELPRPATAAPSYAGNGHLELHSGMRASATPPPGPGTPEDMEPMVAVPAAEWHAMKQRMAAMEAAQGRVASMEAQQSRMLSMVENFALNTQNAFVAVEARVTALERVVDELARTAASSHSADVSRDSTFYNATFAPELSHDPALPPDEQQSEHASIDEAFSAALKGRKQQPVLQLMAKSGAQWALLSEETTALKLLQFVQKALLDNGAAVLPAVLPWLWQLADEDVVQLFVPSSIASSVLAALRGLADDPAAANGNLPMLIATLEWTWGLLAAEGAEEQSGGPAPSSPPRSSTAGGASHASTPPPAKAQTVAAAAPSSPAVQQYTPSRFQQAGQQIPGRVVAVAAAASGLPPMSPAPAGRTPATQPRPRPAGPPPRAAFLSAAAESPRSAHRRRPSLDGIDAMQAQLNAMQAELINIPSPRNL
eukprot:CAMPEP_0117694854 /NCGR_PEP_ID=MMETSP0804-20121206/27734_1 /TAXON_ID=1074897 /ORGANISM="Tetraselmis astigmatica, Strain CCMP880" /LENGTH=892 /DNA_ID=CAMNT_0005508699 /DNA_START=82 /DNA_END=2761 /DNA_ORIENTATION=+